MGLRVQLGLLCLALPATAAASMPCTLWQAKMSPPTNTTHAGTTLRLTMENPGLASGLDLSQTVLVLDESGAPAPVTVAAAPYFSVEVSGLGPGWYTVVLTASSAAHESSDLSMLARDGYFYGEVHVGASAPGLAFVRQCGGLVTLRYSEPVSFAASPAADLALTDADGNPMGCTDNGYAADAGLTYWANLSCGAGAVAAVRVLAPPSGSADAGAFVADFPPVGEAWEMTGWSTDPPSSTSASACRYWQPSLKQRTHENLSASGLGPTYAKCDLRYGNQGCGCGSAAGAAPGLLGVGLALLAGRRARRGRGVRAR